LERDARAKKRGLWKDVTDDQQPAWRQQWLRSLPASAARRGWSDRSRND